MVDIESLVAEVNQLREQLAQPPGSLPFKELVERATSLAGQIKAKAEEAHAGLKARALAMAADLKAKAEALRQPKPKPAEEPPPHPWEDHQGLDPAQLQHMVDSLMQLAKAPPSAARR